MNRCKSSRRLLFAAAALGATLSAGALMPASALAAPPSYTLFEGGDVRPLAISPDRTRLFAVNRPDSRLEIYDITPQGLSHRASVPVGIEPVAVAARSNDEVWVVNHVSDSVSIVSAKKNATPRVIKTLLVGDEPRDIVFAGPGRGRAFITTAHRGQNSPVDPQLTTPGVGRADVWVFDTDNLGTSLGGTPIGIITLFSDTPRALAVTPDGSRVYAAAFHSGNRTTTISQFSMPGVAGLPVPPGSVGPPAPNENHAGVPQPVLGLIVKHDGTHWTDETGHVWDDKVAFNLPDKDVFVIDAMANPPAQLPGAGGFFTGVGTTLFNMVVNPVSGKVYVSNTDARNNERFEGPGAFAGHSVRGHLSESRITVLDANGVHPRHLNKHIDYSVCCAASPNNEVERSLALPLEMAISSNGATLYVAAMSSNKIGVFSTSALEDDTFWPDPAHHITLSGGGPAGLALDEQGNRLYVLTRFDNAISVVDPTARVELAHVAMHNPEPANVVRGRRFLYDASYTSSHGDSSCASCHIFGDMDHVAWDLGNPDGDVLPAPGPFTFNIQFFVDLYGTDFHPMKGPMTTQSLRGMQNHGPMHWRGDRTGGYFEPSAQPDQGSFDEVEAFRQFNPAFHELLGRAAELTASEMQDFTDFALQLTYPPNPIRNLDNSLTTDQAAGRELYFTRLTTAGQLACSGCHVLDPSGNAQYGVERPGFFGTEGRYVGGDFPQTKKIPHLRNVYQKVGMFGLPSDPLVNTLQSGAFMGDQIRGFGIFSDGSIDTVFRFVSNPGFAESVDQPDGFTVGPAGDLERRQVEAFVHAFDSNLAPIVGQQITLAQNNAARVIPRITLFIARADAGECDLVVHGVVANQPVGLLYAGNGTFLPNKGSLPPVPTATLYAVGQIGQQALTFTCAPPGSGRRMAIDADLDGILDGDETP